MIVCSGFLYKEGGKGHSIKNKKKRFFILRDDYIMYFTTKPSDAFRFSDLEKLKGLLYLQGSKVQTLNDNKISLTTRAGKEYILSPASESENDIISIWKESLEKTVCKIKQGDVVLQKGWLSKNKVKTKTTTGYRKRWFQLQGSLLSYYTVPLKIENDITDMKGVIDMSKIAELKRDDTADKSFKYSFLLEIDSMRKYIISSDSEEEINSWLENILKVYSRYALGNLFYDSITEIVLHVERDLDLSTNGKEGIPIYFVLTNKAIRFYHNEEEESIKNRKCTGTLGILSLANIVVKIVNTKPGNVSLNIESEEDSFLLSSFTVDVNSLADLIRKAKFSIIEKVLSNGGEILLNHSVKAFESKKPSVQITPDFIQLNFPSTIKKPEIIPLTTIERINWKQNKNTLIIQYATMSKKTTVNLEYNVPILFDTIQTSLSALGLYGSKTPIPPTQETANLRQSIKDGGRLSSRSSFDSDDPMTSTVIVLKKPNTSSHSPKDDPTPFSDDPTNLPSQSPNTLDSPSKKRKANKRKSPRREKRVNGSSESEKKTQSLRNTLKRRFSTKGREVPNIIKKKKSVVYRVKGFHKRSKSSRSKHELVDSGGRNLKKLEEELGDPFAVKSSKSKKGTIKIKKRSKSQKWKKDLKKNKKKGATNYSAPLKTLNVSSDSFPTSDHSSHEEEEDKQHPSDSPIDLSLDGRGRSRSTVSNDSNPPMTETLQNAKILEETIDILQEITEENEELLKEINKLDYSGDSSSPDVSMASGEDAEEDSLINRSFLKGEPEAGILLEEDPFTNNKDENLERQKIFQEPEKLKQHVLSPSMDKVFSQIVGDVDEDEPGMKKSLSGLLNSAELRRALDRSGEKINDQFRNEIE